MRFLQRVRILQLRYQNWRLKRQRNEIAKVISDMITHRLRVEQTLVGKPAKVYFDHFNLYLPRLTQIMMKLQEIIDGNETQIRAILCQN